MILGGTFIVILIWADCMPMIMLFLPHAHPMDSALFVPICRFFNASGRIFRRMDQVRLNGTKHILKYHIKKGFGVCGVW